MTMKEIWEQEAAKIGGENLVMVIRDIRESLAMILNRLDNEELTSQQLKKAFPEADIDGHRKYHEIQIEILQEKRALRKEIKKKGVLGCAYILLIFCAIALWHEFIALLKTPISIDSFLK